MIDNRRGPGEECLMTRLVALAGTVSALVALGLGSLAAQNGARSGYTPPRTAWGDPDLQGVYTNSNDTRHHSNGPKSSTGATQGSDRRGHRPSTTTGDEAGDRRTGQRRRPRARRVVAADPRSRQAESAVADRRSAGWTRPSADGGSDSTTQGGTERRAASSVDPSTVLRTSACSSAASPAASRPR